MGETVGSFVESLSSEWKGLLALGGALSFGVVVGVFFMGFFGLPAEVRANVELDYNQDARIDSLAFSLKSSSEEWNRRFANLICIIEHERTGLSTLGCGNASK